MTAIDRVDLIVCWPVLVATDVIMLTFGVSRSVVQILRALAGGGAA